MKRKYLMAAALWLYLAAAIALAGELGEGAKLKAGGEEINIRVGHLVPCAADWNGDGKKDLIVGQFSGGKISVYINEGTDAAPVLSKARLLEAGGKEISLPAG